MTIQRESKTAWGFYSKRIWGNVSLFYEYGLGFSFVPNREFLQLELHLFFVRTFWWVDL